MALILQFHPFMHESFLGDLTQIKLFDILKPLMTDKKTGRISIKGKEEGEIFLDRGDILHARTNQYTGENAFFLMMGMRIGRVSFDPDAFLKEKSIPITTEQLLLNWSSRKQEFEKIKEVIPSTQNIFRLSLQKDGKEKNISADQWNLLALSNGTRTISEIAKSLEWDEYKTLKMTYQLFEMGLIEKADSRSPMKKRLVKEEFFITLVTELKKVMGPVAPFIIDDKLVEFGESREAFPEERALPFIEALSEEIPNPQKRSEFLKTTMKLLSF
ncbi:MAG: DUF4388 domain-containing protein [Deltaproteobacteria bacterium]|nr:DUF4388 domain-containing protein [Deltaproteobacteria bacterium]MBM4325090.1 DUF4388 domain-containing protein [Deltaproteobacteria bacterium]